MFQLVALKELDCGTRWCRYQKRFRDSGGEDECDEQCKVWKCGGASFIYSYDGTAEASVVAHHGAARDWLNAK